MAKIWKPVFSMWVGGTAELLRLKDSRVRVARECSGLLNDPLNPRLVRQVSLPAGRVGILTEARMDNIFVGFPNAASVQVTTREALLRTPGGIFGVCLNWPTFKAQFEIEV
jgi:hypothetical protein